MARNLHRPYVQGCKTHSKGVPTAATEDGRLVHSPSLGARVPLGPGHDLGQFHPSHIPIIHSQQCHGQAAGKRGRRTQARSDRQIGPHDDVGPRCDLEFTHQSLSHTPGIVAPIAFPSRLYLDEQINLDVGIVRLRVPDPQQAISAWSHPQGSTELDGHGEHRQQRIVDMLADEVHTPRGPHDEGRRGTTEAVLKEPRGIPVGVWCQPDVSGLRRHQPQLRPGLPSTTREVREVDRLTPVRHRPLGQRRHGAERCSVVDVHVRRKPLT